MLHVNIFMLSTMLSAMRPYPWYTGPNGALHTTDVRDTDETVIRTKFKSSSHACQTMHAEKVVFNRSNDCPDLISNELGLLMIIILNESGKEDL